MKVLLVGVGGYGDLYCGTMLANEDPEIVFEGIVDPYFENCKKRDEVLARNIPVYATMDEFFAEHSADLTVISTPFYLHAGQSICALEHGSNVLCEKPAAPSTEEVRRMREAEERSGKFLAIGFQWSYSDAMQALKRDILTGALGAPVRLACVTLWPRPHSYYARTTGWAGKIRKDGHLVLDSVLSNAVAHQAHNMFFVLGKTMETAARAATVRADVFRTNAIENFDTCAVRMETGEGVPLLYLASHAVNESRGHDFRYEFTDATVTYPNEGRTIIARFRDGTEKNYGNPEAVRDKKFHDCVAAIRAGTRPVCTVETATPHIELIERLYLDCPIRDLPGVTVPRGEDGDCLTYVPGLFTRMEHAFDDFRLLSEEPAE